MCSTKSAIGRVGAGDSVNTIRTIWLWWPGPPCTYVFWKSHQVKIVFELRDAPSYLNFPSGINSQQPTVASLSTLYPLRLLYLISSFHYRCFHHLPKKLSALQCLPQGQLLEESKLRKRYSFISYFHKSPKVYLSLLYNKLLFY